MNKGLIRVIIILVVLIGCAVAVHLYVNSGAPAGILEELKKLHGK